MIAQNVDTIKQFFGKILPKNSENYYITISTKNKETKMVTNKPFHINEIDKIAKYCIDSNELCHVYFGLGLLSSPTKDNKRATNDTVSCLTGFWADIDYGNVGHSKNNLPPTYDDAILLLDGIEKPSIIVATGGGIHAYWVFNEPIIIGDSNRDFIANSLKCFQKSIIQNGISHEWAVDNTANLAQMLRVPETINYKYNKLTSIVETTDIKYNAKIFCDNYTECKMQNNNYGKEEIAGTDYIADICDYNSISEYFLLKTGCKWINYCETNSYNLSEPEWYAMLSIVSRIGSGRQHCHDISKNYSNYSYDETENKIQQAQEKGGPFTCTNIKNTFKNNVCKHCPFSNIISSPIQLSKKDVLNLNCSKFIEFNNKHGAISIAGKSLIINYDETDQLSRLKTFSLSSYDDFNKRYLPVHGKCINGKGEIVEDKFTKLWLNSSYRKDFPNGIIFSPTEDIKGAYNLWQGFAVQPKETGDWSLYKNHIMEVICDNKPEIYNYVFAWMANIVQNLGKNR
uniref:hypothetical protein n=1 Tax=Solidesulfovibrio alcoholivorans TaxID=81406 RepID=UPI0012EC03FE